MRLLRLLIVAAAIGGAIVLLRRLLEEQAAPPEPVPSGGGTPPEPDQSRSSAGTRPTGSSDGGEPTKAELYERAQELEIEGRSKMSKQQLRRAIESAGG